MPPENQPKYTPMPTQAMPPQPPPPVQSAMPSMAPVDKGSQISFIIGLVILVAIIALGAYWYFGSNLMPGSPDGGGGAVMSDDDAKPSATLPSGGANGDASLDADLSAVDTQLGAFNSDNAAVQEGLNDQPVQQAQI